MSRWDQAKDGLRQITGSVMGQRQQISVAGQIEALRHDLSNAVDCLELGNYHAWNKILGQIKPAAEFHLEEQLRKSATDPVKYEKEIVVHYAMAQAILGLVGIFETTVEREPLLRSKLVNLEEIIRERDLRVGSGEL